MFGYFTVDWIQLGGGLALLQREGMVVSIQSFSIGHIDANIISSNGEQLRLTAFYGNLEVSLRTQTLLGTSQKIGRFQRRSVDCL